MIRYALICDSDHEFEAWFSSIADFDAQKQQGHLCCPYCQSPDIDKAIMAPNVATARKKDAIASQWDRASHAMAMINKAASAIREEIETKCDYVGEKFADEAMAMHFGEKDERPIYGEATPQQAKDLREEGVGIAPLPDIIAPKPKTKLN